MKDVTMILPPGEEKEIDCTKLSILISKAIYRTINDLKNKILPKKLRVVNMPQRESITYKEILSPDYRNERVWDYISKIWRTKEAIALNNYIWDRGACKKNYNW
jgi:hypothetical protein